MKTFFSVFLAILAAAVVIGFVVGVILQDREDDRRARQSELQLEREQSVYDHADATSKEP